MAAAQEMNLLVTTNPVEWFDGLLMMVRPVMSNWVEFYRSIVKTSKVRSKALAYQTPRTISVNFK
jgi:hypothetical protein